MQLRSMVDEPHHLFLKKDFKELNQRIEQELLELNDLGCRGESSCYFYDFLNSSLSQHCKRRNNDQRSSPLESIRKHIG